MTLDEVYKGLAEKFREDAFTKSQFRDNHRITVPVEYFLDIMTWLKNEAGFDMLVEQSAADYLNYPDATDRYGVWYVLSNTSTGVRLIVKAWLNDPDPTIPSVYYLWNGADWMERETYDMYGIIFDDHPDLRRILMPDEFTAFPLRKDYPMRGKGERHNFDIITRAES